jgi:hypothetical protein
MTRKGQISGKLRFHFACYAEPLVHGANPIAEYEFFDDGRGWMYSVGTLVSIGVMPDTWAPTDWYRQSNPYRQITFFSMFTYRTHEKGYLELSQTEIYAVKAKNVGVVGIGLEPIARAVAGSNLGPASMVGIKLIERPTKGEVSFLFGTSTPTGIVIPTDERTMHLCRKATTNLDDAAVLAAAAVAEPAERELREIQARQEQEKAKRAEEAAKIAAIEAASKREADARRAEAAAARAELDAQLAATRKREEERRAALTPQQRAAEDAAALRAAQLAEQTERKREAERQAELDRDPNIRLIRQVEAAGGNCSFIAQHLKTHRSRALQNGDWSGFQETLGRAISYRCL